MPLSCVPPQKRAGICGTVAIEVNCVIARFDRQNAGGRRVDGAVQADPVTALSGAAAVGRPPRSSLYQTPPSLPISTCAVLAGLNASAWKSGCWSYPRLIHVCAAVVGAEDAARADAVVELAGGEDDVRVRRIDLDHVVVEALAAAVVLDVVLRRAAGKHRPARGAVRRLEDAARVMPVGVDPVEADVERAGPAGDGWEIAIEKRVWPPA